MNITITGKEIKATDAIKEYIEKKAERLVKYFGFVSPIFFIISDT